MGQTTRGLPGSDWRYAARRTWHGFVRHRGLDSAAALTFFSALAIFPAALAVVSMFSLVEGRQNSSRVILDIIDEVAQGSTVNTLKEPITQLFTIANPGMALTIGLVLWIWSLSSFSTAFGRAVNSVYEVQEGRQIWKFRGLMLILAVFLLVVFAGIILALVVTPTVASAIGVQLGVGEPWLATWSIARWPILLILIALVMAVLYYFTPNVRHEKMRWVSYGTVFAIVAWGVATTIFGLYVSNVGTYDRIYGWLGGGLALLVWLYITNFVLVLGAEVDAEVVRLRQLGAGVQAEETIQLPMRDTTRNLMLARQRAQDIADGRQIREAATPPAIE
ncbi:MAG: YihY/virulence factor BrkB family protein [Salinibacterium sp.]|nr:YihY/virulence factor BrkB family protein [Salinibacterium sp.]